MRHEANEIDEEPTDPIGPGDLLNAIARSRGVSIDTPQPAPLRSPEAVAEELDLEGTLEPAPRRPLMAPIQAPPTAGWGAFLLKAGVALLVVVVYGWVLLGG